MPWSITLTLGFSSTPEEFSIWKYEIGLTCNQGEKAFRNRTVTRMRLGERLSQLRVKHRAD